VTYQYTLSNQGETPITVNTVRSVLNDTESSVLDTPLTLAVGASEVLFGNPVFVSQSQTTSISVDAQVEGYPEASCPVSASSTITVEAAPSSSCEDGKPSQLGFRYVGGTCADSNNEQGDKADCIDGEAVITEPVTVIVYDKKEDNVLLEQNLNVGDIFTLSPSEEKSKFDSETIVRIFSGEEQVQSLNIHTSCSRPLNIGDQFGSLVLHSFLPDENKGKKKQKGKKSKKK
jgi:hypothetical protein